MTSDTPQARDAPDAERTQRGLAFAFFARQLEEVFGKLLQLQRAARIRQSDSGYEGTRQLSQECD
jgi:hypothetical protein